MYQVLYRKYRPQNFSDVIGQGHITKTLQNEISTNHISHAYLFTGSRGTGKTTCAKILSKAINCLSPVNSNPCGKCKSCTGIDDGSILDVVEIDAASNNGVDNIRALKEESAFTPVFTKYRVYIVDEVHMLSIGAFNALLKILEEPPSYVVFILATTEVNKLPQTILSRCQRFDFNRISANEIAMKITEIALNEGKTLNDDAALLIARMADGAMRDALSLLDQCIGQADEITSDVVSKSCGITGNAYVFNIAFDIASKDFEALIFKISELYSKSKDFVRLIDELINCFRNVLIIKTVSDPLIILEVAKEDFKRLKDLSNRLNLQDILHIISVLQEASAGMNRGSKQQIQMEVAVSKLCFNELDDSKSALIRRISNLENSIKSISVFKAPKSDERVNQEEICVQKPSDIKVEFTENLKRDNIIEQKKQPKAEQNDKIIPMDDWDKVINEVSKTSKTLSIALKGSKAFIDNGVILIDAPSELEFTLIKNQNCREALSESVQKFTSKVYSFKKYDKSVKCNEQKGNKIDELDNLIDSLKKTDIDLKVY